LVGEAFECLPVILVKMRQSSIEGRNLPIMKHHEVIVLKEVRRKNYVIDSEHW
jgi:hypothetical protein